MNLFDEDSLISEIQDVQPQMFPESCRETIMKFQQLGKLSDTELDFIVSYLSLTIKEVGPLVDATRISPASLAARILRRVARDPRKEGILGPASLRTIVLAQRHIVNLASALSGRLSFEVDGIFRGKAFDFEWRYPYYDKNTARHNEAAIDEFLAKWPTKNKDHLTTRQIEELLEYVSERDAGRSYEPVETRTPLLSAYGSERQEFLDMANSASAVLREVAATLRVYLQPLSKEDVEVDPCVVEETSLADLIAGINASGCAVLNADRPQDLICIFISGEIPRSLAEDTDDGDIHAFIAEHLYETVAAILSKSLRKYCGEQPSPPIFFDRGNPPPGYDPQLRMARIYVTINAGAWVDMGVEICFSAALLEKLRHTAPAN